jgi:cytochrome P450
MSTATKAVQTAKFLGGMYRERARVLYWAHVRGDLFSRLVLPNHHTDPYLIYEEMRERGPMLPTRLGNYSTTSHRLCKEVLRSRRFGVAPEDGSEDLANPAGLDLSLLELNPPDHTRIRRLAAPAFTPRRMAGYVELVDQAIQQLLDECEREREFDLMTSFASPLPIAVVTHLLGLPNEPERFRRLGSTIARALDGIWSLGQARMLAAADTELRATFAELLDRRAADPGNDLVSVLVSEQGRDISAAELSALVRLLLIAGFETTVNAIGNGMRWLLADPEQWELLVKDPERSTGVVEELLRFDPPVQQTARVAHQPTEVGDVLVAKNQWVITLLAAANRDPDAYPAPNHFDIARQSPVEHLAFSGGIHYCLGSPLARLELTQAFRALAERFPHIRQTGPIIMRPGTTLRGPLRFPVTVSS